MTRSIRLSLLFVALSVLATACSSNEPTDPSTVATEASTVASTALANSQGGALEVLRYDNGPGLPILDTAPLPGPLPIALDLTGCEQLDIVRWRLTGTVEAPEDVPLQGWIQFGVGSARGMDVEVQVNHSGTFDIEVPTHGLADLAAACEVVSPDGEARYSGTAAAPFDGVFIWDAEPDSLASLGVGLVAGDANDPRRAWAEQYWFGQPLPFDQVLAVDRDLVGVPIVQNVGARTRDGSPCREITLSFTVGELVQGQSCTASDERSTDEIAPDVQASWVRHGPVEGLVFEDRGRYVLVGSAGGFNVTITSRSAGDVVTIASALRFYDNDEPAEQRFTEDPLDEDEIVDRVLALNFREVGRIDGDGSTFLVTEGPLNPENPNDYLRQVRIHRLDQVGRYWNPILVAGGPWDRCLGVAPYEGEQSFVVTGNTGDEVERDSDGSWELLDGQGRILLVDDLLVDADLRLLIDGEVVECVAPVVTTLPSTVPTTTGTTVPGSTDTTVPGVTDTTAP